MKNKRMIIKIESLLNRTPHLGVVIMFFTLCLIVISAIVSHNTDQYFYKAIDPLTLETTHNVFEVKNFMNPENFLEFASSGLYILADMNSILVVLVTFIAFGIAEKSGYLYTLFKKLLFNVPKVVVTFVIVFLGIISNVTSTGTLNAGYLFLLPLGAFIYMGNGRNPLAGIAAMFAAVFGAYSVNVLLTSYSLAINSMTESLTQTVIPSYEVVGATNRLFMLGIMIISTIVITWITEKYIINLLPVYDLEIYTYHRITTDEKKGLIAAIFVSIVMFIFYVILLMPKTILDIPGSGTLLGDYNPIVDSYLTQLIQSPFMSMFVMHMSYYFIIAGTVYGLVSKKFSSLSDVIKAAVVSVADHAEYFVLIFLLGGLIHVLYQSNLGLLLLLKLTPLVDQAGSAVGLVVLVFLVTLIINIFVPSSVTKWSIMGPIIVPIFLEASINPIAAQSAFQLGDSPTNIITLILPYSVFVYVLFNTYAKKTKQHFGNGTFVKLTLPYSVVLTVVFFVYLAIWILLNLDFSPGVGIYI